MKSNAMKLLVLKRGVKREPLKSLREMADDLGVAFGTLKNYMRYHGGPQPEFEGKGNLSSKQNYYQPSEMRKWWHQLQDEGKV
jgi:hypothetical protein